jgi:hypothetical protein
LAKRYGVDGPAQLAGRNRPVPPDERFGWFGRRERLMSGREDWARKVVCTCGRENDFRVLITDPSKPLISRNGIELGVVRLELVCNACSSELTVFDNQLNGWNAVIVGERSSLPSDYIERVKANLQPRKCHLCGSTHFGCVVWFCYDAHPDELPPSEADWDEAFGAFAAWAVCSRCSSAEQLAEAETA